MSLKLNERYPGRYNNPSAGYPQGSFKNRTSPIAKDGSYLEQDWANDKEGFFQSLLATAGIAPNGLVDKVGASQYHEALLQIITSKNLDLLNTPTTNVASAANVNLTTGAPNTRQIVITGTTNISGFTVAAGQCYFVKFSGGLLLTNGAGLVTQSGANITTAQGDTCVIRATAANVVEILFYTPGIPKSLGYRQTQQNMLPSRTLNTTYTAPDRLIWVMASINMAPGVTPLLVIGGRTIGTFGNNGSGANVVNFSFPVNAFDTYRINNGTSASYWDEMR